jgi:ABC transport system ATP-binding/permease protein
VKPRLPTVAASDPLGPLPDTTLPGGAAASGPVLVVHDSGRVLRVPLGSMPLTIGRDPSADIVLASRFVSAKHARIERDGAGHRIVDLGAMNGLLRAGRRMPRASVAPLSDGDTLRIGDPTTGSFVMLVYHNPTAQRASQETTVVRRCPLPADRPVFTIGREGCDIELENPVISRRHAVIERAGKGHVLRDLGSMNGTFVDGRRASRVSLAKGAVIQIGPFKLVYDGESLLQYDHRGALRLDGRRLSQRVGGGRLILRDVSISIAPREFVALVGGSGAGKSTLMKALAGYAPATNGQVLVNGDDFYEQLDAYRALLGYVPQDDTLHRELPAARALAYAARLRLPADTSRAEIDERVARVLESVDMTAHRDKRVDQLSGGQRKRVSIAAELLADPSLFFLDEPTSGLDPGLEKRMMYTLRRLADGGRTIVLVTHATANIAQCDHVAFMAEGRLVFFGPPADALRFFGVESGDFADIYSKLEGAADPRDRERWAVVEEDLQKDLEAFRRAHPDAGRTPSLAELWERRYRASRQYAENVVRRLGEAPAAAQPSRTASRRRRTGISGLRKLAVLALRYLDLLLQDRRNLLILLLQAPIIGYLMTLVARSDAIVGPRASSYDAKIVLFMLSTVAVWFGVINAAREITKESAVYRRERLAGVGVVPYVMSKVLVLSLLVLAQSATLLAVVGREVNFPASGVLLDGTWELYVTTTLTALAGLSLGLAISAWAKTADRAISVVPLVLIPQILFSGVLFPFGSGISTTRILSWFTVSRWAMDAYGTTINLGRLPPPTRPAAAEFTFTRDNLLLRWEILGSFTLGCLILACLLLWWRDRDA